MTKNEKQTRYMKLLQRVGHDWATDKQQQLFLRHQKLRHKRQWSLGDGEQMKQALLVPWLTPLREFIVFSLGGETQEEPRSLPELRRQTLSRRSRKLEFTRQSTEQDRASQRNNFRDKYLTDFWLHTNMRKPYESKKRMMRGYYWVQCLFALARQ